MLHPDTTIGVTTLNVSDLPKVTAFYRDIIGLQIRAQTEALVELGTQTRAILRLQPLKKGKWGRRSPGLFHLAIRLPNRQVLADWLSHYIKHDAPGWQGASDHGASHALYLTDPDGNGLEIMMDWPRDKWPRSADGQPELYTETLDMRKLLSEQSETPWSVMPEETEVSHIHLRVADLPKARLFYVDLLGWDKIAAYGTEALFISAGGYHHHIGLNTWESRGQPDRTDTMYGLAEYEILYPSVAERDRIVAQLTASGITVSDNSVRDPFNNKILLATV